MKNNNNKVEQNVGGDATAGNGILRTLIGRLARIAPSRRPITGDASTSTEKRKRREKRPLQRDITPSNVFPVDALGSTLGDAARALEYGIQAPIGLDPMYRLLATQDGKQADIERAHGTSLSGWHET